MNNFVSCAAKFLKLLIMSILKKVLLTIGVVFISIGAIAQSVEEAGAKYNEGNGFYKEKDFASAITAYESAMGIAKEAGADAADLLLNIEKQLLNSYYNEAKGLYKGGKFDAAIAMFEKSYAMAEEVGDATKSKNSKSYIAKVRTSKGSSLLKKNKVDEAMAEYTMAIEILPKYYKAYYGLMLAYKSKADYTNMMANADKVIELGADNSKAAKTVKKTKSTASKALVNAGAKEIQDGSAQKAIEFINNSFNYMPGNANSHYYLSLAYLKEKNWAEAISAAEKAVSIEPEKDKGDIYFTLGQAHEGNGDSANACAAYKNVTTGPNVEAAKYQMTQVLKCS